VGVTLVLRDQDVSVQLSWGSRLELGWFHNDAAATGWCHDRNQKIIMSASTNVWWRIGIQPQTQLKRQTR
jgi:hypothetical protein